MRPTPCSASGARSRTAMTATRTLRSIICCSAWNRTGGWRVPATNRKSALDSAFLRRLRFVVDFLFPAVADRRRLWSRAFLAARTRAKGCRPRPSASSITTAWRRCNLTGGHIHNVALNAAFLAAQAGTAITMPLILEAARWKFANRTGPSTSWNSNGPSRRYRWCPHGPESEAPAPA